MVCYLLSFAGRFGVGMKAYFVFLRYLVYLNLLHCLLIGGFILGPTALYGRSNSTSEFSVNIIQIKPVTKKIYSKSSSFFSGIFTESLRYGVNDSVLDFFLGTVK